MAIGYVTSRYYLHFLFKIGYFTFKMPIYNQFRLLFILFKCFSVIHKMTPNKASEKRTRKIAIFRLLVYYISCRAGQVTQFVVSVLSINNIPKMSSKDKKLTTVLKDHLHFKCNLCNVTVSGSISEIRNHSGIHFPEETPCKNDLVTFQGQHYLTLSKKMLVQVQQSNICPYNCGAIPESKIAQFCHVVQEHERFCPKCHPEKINPDKIDLHVRSKTHKAKSIMRCPMCRFTSECVDAFWKHRLEKHYGDLKNVPEIRINQKADVVKHQDDHHHTQ